MKQAHEFNGAKYAQASAHQTAWGLSLMNLLHLRGDERILDLGCGDGRNTLRLADMVPQGSVVGLDASAGMIAEAAKHASQNCMFVRIDMLDMPYEEEFDVVFSNAALHWVLDQERLARQIYRALRRGGLLLAEFAADGNCLHFMNAARSVMHRAEYREAFRDFVWPWNMPTPEAFASNLREAGFAHLQVEPVSRPHQFQDACALAA